MNKTILPFLISFLAIWPCASAFSAGTMDAKEAFEKGIQFASSKKETPQEIMRTFHPEKVIVSYSDHPEEVSYASQEESLKSIYEKNLNQDHIGKSIVDGAQSRNEKFSYLKDNPAEMMKVFDNSTSIYESMMGQFSDCATKTNCVTTYKTEICNEAPHAALRYCTQTLNVEMSPKQNVTHYPLVIHISTKEHYYAGATIDTTTGHIDWSGPHDSSFLLEGRIPAQIDCKGLEGSIVSVHPQNPGTHIDSLSYPSCANGTKLNVHVTNSNKKEAANIVIKLDVISTTIIQEPKDKWSNACSGMTVNGICTLKDERCLESNTSHRIDGTEVTRPCWQKESTYQCGGDNVLDTCLPLRDRGCEQIGSKCQHMENGACSYYEQVFQCPVKSCTDVGMICNGETYCLDGDCIKQQKQADRDFQRSVSALSATQEAAKSYSGTHAIFTGQRKTCDKVFLGFINCCADEGWGKDINLAQCSADEKDLGKAKENLQAFYLGEYCQKDKLGICVEHRQAYCTFPTVLARIVQVQGRKEQLGIGFGTPENADCRGLTREEFSQLNLGSMNFSDFYSEIAKKQHLEPQDKINERVSDNAKSVQTSGKAYG